MKVTLFLVVVAVALPHVLCASSEFEQWKQKFNKRYATEKEENYHFQCFQTNTKEVRKLNSVHGNTATYALGPFGDVCADDFATTHLRATTKRRPQIPFAPRLPVHDIPQAVDWRQKGVVTPIKNQGHCGSCWAFSAVGNMEGQHALATKQLIGLSEEEITECAKDFNEGCNGGDPALAFLWVLANKGIDSERGYPYTSGTGKTGRCDKSKTSQRVAAFKDLYYIEPDENQMAAFVAKHGPLSICLDAKQWAHYHSGIMSNCTSTIVSDHCVLAVGYNQTSAGEKYWIVKNSWGTNWGMDGYLYLQRGTDQCGVRWWPASIAGHRNVTAKREA